MVPVGEPSIRVCSIVCPKPVVREVLAPEEIEKRLEELKWRVGRNVLTFV